MDKFYTKDKVVELCLGKLDFSQFVTIVEPSAGNGSFSSKIPGCLAYDVLPEGDGIVMQDFLKLEQLDMLEKPVLVVGNPPFGRQASLALKFIKKSCTFANTIAFILPKSFKKQSMIDKIPTIFHLELELDLPDYSFLLDGVDYDVPCVFQVWNRRDFARKIVPTMSPNGFMFVKKSEFPDFAFRRVGVYAGKVYWDYISKSEQSHYFIKATEMDAITLYNTMDNIVWMHNNTVGPRSISKQELIFQFDKSSSI